jgi:hypothetical protein
MTLITCFGNIKTDWLSVPFSSSGAAKETPPNDCLEMGSAPLLDIPSLAFQLYRADEKL